MVHHVPSDSGFDFLQRWYADRCDGEWEHEFGIRVATLDNPGWELEVDLVDTSLEGRVVARTRKVVAGDGWMFVESDGEAFQVSCDAMSLSTAFEEFRKLADSE